MVISRENSEISKDLRIDASFGKKFNLFYK